ncbi:type IV conjugative transfer system pilin TraA, partial [Vibrio crassostreae]|uniref:type IV conjugative transfer system pilin TraA n=1 Tax=Vibrio crassostreae TaxID=246167 RepID=UPI0028991653
MHLLSTCKGNQMKNKTLRFHCPLTYWRHFCTLLAVYFACASPAYADDLFASGKDTVTNTVGTGSSGEFYILVAGLIGGIIVGIMQKNWVGGIIG